MTNCYVRRWLDSLISMLLATPLFMCCATAVAQSDNTWTGLAGDSNWNTNGNWDIGEPPSAQFDETAVIANGDSVFLQASASDASGLELTGSNLEIRPGGQINFLGAANINAGSSLTMVGSGQTFSTTGDITFASTSTYIPKINSLVGQTPISADGAINFNSTTIAPSLDGVFPTGSETWIVADAGSIDGNFILDRTSASLPAGKVFKANVVAGGAGEQIVLGIQSVLSLNVDTDTGAASISSPSGDAIRITGYGIASTTGQLNPIGWNSLEQQAVPGFSKAGIPNTNNLDEIAGPIDSTTQGSVLVTGTQQPLGNPFTTTLPFGEVPDLTFQYVTSEDEVVDGVVEYSGLASINNLLLTVDPSTGNAQLTNSSNTTIQLKGYSILSDSGSLKPSNSDWNSLDDQDVDNSGTGGVAGYVEEANPTQFALTELIPDIETEVRALELSPGESYLLGDLFNTGGTRDLVLEFVIENDSLTGDYNGDGSVNIADYVVWRDNLGSTTVLPNDSTPGTVTTADYNAWKANFGSSGSGNEYEILNGVVKYESLSPASASVQVVPEPNTAWLCVPLVMLCLSRTKRNHFFRSS